MKIKKFEDLFRENVNFHYGNVNKEIGEYSDNIFSMRGRDTGHFGSGLYFSTYPNEKKLNKYRYNNYKSLQNIEDGLYAIDFDNIPNMFEVTSDEMGDILYNALKKCNRLFYQTYYNGIKPNIISQYRELKYEFSMLNIKFLSLDRLKELFNEASEDFKDISNKPKRYGSFSTRIMTELGYNGIDVSEIPKYDNTLHGSVVYNIFALNYNKDAKTPKLMKKFNLKKHLTDYYYEDLNNYSYDELKYIYKNIETTDISYQTYMKLNDKNKKLLKKRLIELSKEENINGRKDIVARWSYVLFPKELGVDKYIYISNNNMFDFKEIDNFYSYLYNNIILNSSNREEEFDELYNDSYNIYDEILVYEYDDEINKSKLKIHLVK